MGMIVVGFQQEGKVSRVPKPVKKRKKEAACAGSDRCFSKG